MLICGYTFEGPYRIGTTLIDRAAVYVILSDRNSVVDVGQSGETGTRLSNHDRSDCWSRHGGAYLIVKWMPSSIYSREDREILEKKIRDKYDPSCGKR